MQNIVKPAVLLVYTLTEEGMQDGKYPAGLGYLRSSIVQAGYNCDILTLDCSTNETIQRELIERLSKYQMIGFSCYVDNILDVERIADWIKQVYDIPIIAGGPEVKFNHGKIFDRCPYIDAIINGEGERAIVHLCRDYFQNGRFIDPFPGVSYQDMNGQALLTDHVNRIEDLDNLPFPSTHYDNIAIGESEGYHYHYLIGLSRGCMHRCIFCYWNTCDEYADDTVVYRSRDSCVHEVMRFMTPRLKPYSQDLTIGFTDDFINIKLLLEVVTVLKGVLARSNVNINYGAQVTIMEIVRLTAEEIGVFNETGCAWLMIGLENFHKDVLRRYRKPHNPQQAVDAIMILRDAGILSNPVCELGFILWDPITTIDELRENLSMIQSLNLYNNIYTGKFFHTKIYRMNDMSKFNIYDDDKLDKYYQTWNVLDYFEDRRVAGIYDVMNKVMSWYQENDLVEDQRADNLKSRPNDLWNMRVFDFFGTLLYDNEAVPPEQRFYEFINTYQHDLPVS